MSTTWRQHNSLPPVPQRKKEDQHHDRVIAIVVLFLMIALIALVAWLGSLTGAPGVNYDGIDWYLMP